MKKIIYGTILLFVAILIVLVIVAINTPVQTVKYENGAVIEDNHE